MNWFLRRVSKIWVFICLRAAADREAKRLEMLRDIYDLGCEEIGERRASHILSETLTRVGRAREALQIIKERRIQKGRPHKEESGA
jgi:hypothetical protein